MGWNTDWLIQKQKYLGFRIYDSVRNLFSSYPFFACVCVCLVLLESRIFPEYDERMGSLYLKVGKPRS